MRSSHGGTGHVLILVHTAGLTVSCRVIESEDRIDISAGSRDFRLHQQRSGDTPGTETADLSICSLAVDFGNGFPDYFRGAGIAGIAAGFSGFGACLDCIGIRECHCDHREGSRVTVKHHAEGTRHIVRNDKRFRVETNQVVALLKERQSAAVNYDDLSLKGYGLIDSCVFFFRTDSVNIYEVIGSSYCNHLRACGV